MAFSCSRRVLGLQTQKWLASACSYSCAAEANMRTIVGEQLSEIRSAGTWKTERVITSKQDDRVTVEGQKSSVINFCANNYLGLSSHPAIVEAGQKALETHGAGLSSVRFICGTNDLHIDLERKISEFHARDDTILYASCFDANAGLFETLLGPDDAVLSDELNHASIIDGIRLCKAQKHRYKHRDLKDLEQKLAESAGCRMKMIVTDGVFSMDGNIAPLREISELAEKYNAITFIDECHATGFLGATGRGTEEHLGMNNDITIINSTLGKALGGAAGGYTSGPQELIDLLRQRSRPYLFSNALPPPVVACASKVFDMLLESPKLAEAVSTNTARFRGGMKKAGFTVGGDESHPICPVMLGDARLAAQFADKMLDRGIYVIGFSYPVVAKGKARIRVQVSACHTVEEIDTAVDAFHSVGKELGIVQ